jgi:hypothetical protein
LNHMIERAYQRHDVVEDDGDDRGE